jgi:hypothetical protein
MKHLFSVVVFQMVFFVPFLSSAQVKNGSFEENSVGTSESGMALAIKGWRLYTINPRVTVHAAIVSPGSDGNNAVELRVTNSGMAQGQYGFDNFTDKTPVVAGKLYNLSFDLSGEVGDNVAVTLADFKGATFSKVQTQYPRIHITQPGFQTYTFKYIASTDLVCIGFYVAEMASGTQTVTLDNVRLVPADEP